MVTRVKECEACGEVCSTMDTLCPRCQQYGTLRERFQCSRCQRLLENQTCWACGPEAESEQIASKISPHGSGAEDLAQPQLPPNLVDPHAVHPALAAGVGGAVFGGAVGALAGHFFLGENPLVLGLIGLVIGTTVGALLGGNVSRDRR